METTWCVCRMFEVSKERIFEEWGLAEGEAKIISYLRKKGYLFCSVSSTIKRTDNEIRVIYRVNPDRYILHIS